MTHDQPASMPDDDSGDQGRAPRRRAAADAGPPRFVDRFALDARVDDAPTPPAEVHPDDDAGPVTKGGPSMPAAVKTTAGTTAAAPGAPAGSPVVEPPAEADGPVRISVTPLPAATTPQPPASVAPSPAVPASATAPTVAERVAPLASSPAGGQAMFPSGAQPSPDNAPSTTSGEARVVFAPIGNASTEGLRPREGRKSFLSDDASVIPAESGFRGFLGRMGFRFAPSQAELAIRADIAKVSRHWPGPRTIAVVNGKGGANKTPTTVMLAAVFARNGGGPVLAWDNNETRGTLGWRTEQGPHEATVLDLLPQTGALLAPSAQSALLARYVHHQTADKYDVLRSKPDVLATQQKITADDFDALHEVASKYFRLNVIDSGNDETAERWLRMIHHTNQLVIATTTLEEHAEAGALLLEALRARGGAYGELSERAVVIVSQSDKNGTQTQAQSIANGFNDLARTAVTIPFDIALLKGRIRFSALRPATQRAWLAAASAVAEGL